MDALASFACTTIRANSFEHSEWLIDRGQTGVRGARRRTSQGAAGALLPHAGFSPGGGRPGPGHVAPSLARAEHVSGTGLAAHVAVSHRDKCLPDGAGAPAASRTAGGR